MYISYSILVSNIYLIDVNEYLGQTRITPSLKPVGKDKDDPVNVKHRPGASQLERSNSSKRKVKVQRESVVDTIDMVGQGLQKLQSTSSNKEKNNKPERYLSADMDMVKVDTRRNIATVLLGQAWGEAMLDFFIYKGMLARVICVLLFALWIVGQFMGLISLFGVFADFRTLAGLLTLLCVFICGYSLLIIDVLKELLKRFDTFNLMYNVITLVVCLSLILRDDRKVWVCTALLLSGLWSTVADAMPTFMRQITKIFWLGCGVVTLSTIQVGLYFNFIKAKEARYVIVYA